MMKPYNTIPVFDLLASMFQLNVHEKLIEQIDYSDPSKVQMDNWVNKIRNILPPSVKEELEVAFLFPQ
ncbi:hypothetical protein [Neobacillus sp. PS3-40]|uniref:hypothetical protein n=1 Tax=Neobacillus sp. PS3-40 TaxID=3070679 RepID=UPI0027E13548|nr:hypothetical protein [Neobacillus sp. PS3-40]WML42786.1 hypothetical protein RCG20_13175 [Neobacillus sp. PS3-40]